MNDQLKLALEWCEAHETLLYGLGAASFGLLVVTVLVVPLLVAVLPADEFLHERHHRPVGRKHGLAISVTLLVLRNLLGAVCVLLGIAMLVLPGQGLLTIFIGVLFLDFPGKRRIVLWSVSKPLVQRTLNWMRRRRRVLEFEFQSAQGQPLSRKDLRAQDETRSATTTIAPESPTKKKTSS